MCSCDEESVDDSRESVVAILTDAPSAPLAIDGSSSGDSARGIPKLLELVRIMVVRGVASSSYESALLLAWETELNRGCSDTGRYLGSSTSGCALTVGLRVRPSTWDSFDGARK